MNHREMLSHVDHTLLTVTAGWEDVKTLCDEAMEYGTASVCIAPAYVARAAEYMAGRAKVCTVIGFPNGYSTKETKVFETENAIQNGADEIDMVANIGMIKGGLFTEVEAEIRAIKRACGDKILKVIVEACLLTEEEKVAMCGTVIRAGADFIKTSTGFSAGGATSADVELMVREMAGRAKVKAAGGISTLEDAEQFLKNGADRLGTSRIVKLLQGIGTAGY